MILKIKGWEGIFISFLKNYVVCVNHSDVSDSLRPHGLQLTRLLCPWNSPGKNTGVDSHSLLQGNFPTQVSHIAGRWYTIWATRAAYVCVCVYDIFLKILLILAALGLEFYSSFPLLAAGRVCSPVVVHGLLFAVSCGTWAPGCEGLSSCGM